jgi:hypothetical protein
LLFRGTLVLVLLSMFIDYFKCFAHAYIIGIALKLKWWGAFVSIYRFVIRYLHVVDFRKVQDYVMK